MCSRFIECVPHSIILIPVFFLLFDGFENHYESKLKTAYESKCVFVEIFAEPLF